MRTTVKELEQKLGLPYTQVSGGLKVMVALGLAKEVDKVVTPNRKGRRQVVYEVDEPSKPDENV